MINLKSLSIGKMENLCVKAEDRWAIERVTCFLTNCNLQELKFGGSLLVIDSKTK